MNMDKFFGIKNADYQYSTAGMGMGNRFAVGYDTVLLGERRVA